MDPLTKQPVRLSKTPDMRLADFSPGVPPPIRGALRQSRPTFDTLLSYFEATINVDAATPQEAVTNDSIDFVLANRDMMSLKFSQAVTRLKMKVGRLVVYLRGVSKH